MAAEAADAGIMRDEKAAIFILPDHLHRAGLCAFSAPDALLLLNDRLWTREPANMVHQTMPNAAGFMQLQARMMKIRAEKVLRLLQRIGRLKRIHQTGSDSVPEDWNLLHLQTDHGHRSQVRLESVARGDQRPQVARRP